MPKELFFTIDNEKQKRIIEASLKEFSEKVYNDASINQIIQVADISRGSFYKYFEDKEDLYFFIVDRVIKDTTYIFLNDIIEKKPENIFLVYRELFNYNLKMISNEKYRGFFKNMYLSINYEFQQKLKIIFGNVRNELIVDKGVNILNNSDYDEINFTELMNILELINRDLLTQKIADDLTNEKIFELYDLRIEILKNINKLIK